ncbi:F-box/FBD/LRR-repeat protein At1g13570-like isoform X2 [Carex rostrata]
MNIFQRRRCSVDLDLEQDYISNLPKNLKEEVLMKLPIKEAIRTSLLSTKWKNAWMLIPNLVFTEDCSQSTLIRLVDIVLSLHYGPILQFKLIRRHACNEAIGRWMLILSRNGIKNLYVKLGSFVEKCIIPSSFFSCIELEDVLLYYSIIHVPPSFLGFKFLRTLRLFSCNLTGITVAKLISSCHLLESLELDGIVEYGRLVIHAPNLRWLSFTGGFVDLCLETPKLLFANIFLDCYQNFTMPSEDCKSNILQVLGILSAIEELQLCSEIISLHEEEGYPSSSLAQSFWEVKGIESDLFNCLEIVKILNFEYPASILNVAKFVFCAAPVLEKLVIREESYFDDLKDSVAFLKQLASFPRLSKMAEIVFVE